MRCVSIILVLLGLVLPSTSAAASTWYWHPARAEHALEVFEEGVSARHWGADCSGFGRKIRSDDGDAWLYRRFACDVYDRSGDWYGSGTLRVRGPGLRSYSFHYEDY